MSQNIFSFVPELYFQNQKDLPKSRIFHDDCAVVHVSDSFRIIAARGMEESIGKPLFDALNVTLPKDDRFVTFLETEESCVLLPAGEDSLLLFSAWYRATDLLLAVRLHAPEEKVRKVLDLAQRSAINSVFRHEEETTDSADVERRLEEIFYYTTKILTPREEIWNHCLTVSNFIGCRLEGLSLPVSIPKLDADEFHRLTAFLVCTLLELRHRYGKTKISQTSKTIGNVGKVPIENEDDFALTVEQIQKENAESQARLIKSESCEESFPFANLPAFHSFSFVKEGENFIFQAIFHTKSKLYSIYLPSNRETYSFRIGLIVA